MSAGWRKRRGLLDTGIFLIRSWSVRGRQTDRLVFYDDRSRSDLEVAAVLFAESGYAGTSLNSILRQSGVTKGGFYFHFASKEALAVAVVDHLRERWLASTVDEARDLTRGIDRLRAMAWASTRAYREMPGYRAIAKLCLYLLTVRPDLGPKLRATFGAWIDTVESVFRQAQDEGDIPDSIDARTLAEVTVAAFTGMQEISELMSGGSDLDRRVDMYVTLLMQVLGVSGTKAASAVPRSRERTTIEDQEP